MSIIHLFLNYKGLNMKQMYLLYLFEDIIDENYTTFSLCGCFDKYERAEKFIIQDIYYNFNSKNKELFDKEYVRKKESNVTYIHRIEDKEKPVFSIVECGINQEANFEHYITTKVKNAKNKKETNKPSMTSDDIRAASAKLDQKKANDHDLVKKVTNMEQKISLLTSMMYSMIPNQTELVQKKKPVDKGASNKSKEKSKTITEVKDSTNKKKKDKN